MKKAKEMATIVISAIMISGILVALARANSPITINYGDVTLIGGFQSGHFDEVWDLTAGDLEIIFTYDANGLVDDAGCHAWGELGVRPVGYGDFNPYHMWGPGVKTVDLLAGQHIDVGDVIVQSDGTTLQVRYVTTGDWYLLETHVAIAPTSLELPQTKTGNPIPGKFAYSDPHGPTQDYPYNIADPGYSPIYIAAHAVVAQRMTAMGALHIVSDLQTLAGGVPAVYAWEPGPLYPDDGPDDTAWEANSLWDQNINYDFKPTGADWIWNTYRVDDNAADAVTGEIVEFTRAFTLPTGLVSATGTLRITCDNGYEAYLNGGFLGSAQVTLPGWRTSNFYQPWVSSQNWQSVETYPVVSGFVPGLNTLAITGVNEHMDTDDPPDPFLGTASNNPAGLIYTLDICYEYEYYVNEETAWGDGDDFPGENWGTYFTYVTEGAGVWLATDYDWTVNTFDPDPPSSPILDLDDKLILQRVGGHGEGDYNLPSTPPNPWANHRIWFDRDGVDPWQAMNPLAVDGGTYNTGGTYEIVITLAATGDTSGTAHMTINGLDQGFETDGDWSTMELTPAGMTFSGDMKHMQVFYGLFGYGATHTVAFEDITVTFTPSP